MTPEQTLEWLAQQHFDQCCEERPIQDWIRKMKSQLPEQPAVAEQHKQRSVSEHLEPVAWMNAKRDMTYTHGPYNKNDIPLYTIPPQRKPWVSLTDEEMWGAYTGGSDIINLDYAKAIEAKLKEKNTND